MQRLPHYLVVVVTAGAIAAVFGPRAREPTELDSSPDVVRLGVPFPESMTLRHLAKWRVARRAATGQLSLIEAAALFRVLNGPTAAAMISSQHSKFWVMSEPVRTENEQLCGQVVEFVSMIELDGSLELAAAGVARLTAEYREELNKHGGIYLPDPAGLPTAEELLENARIDMTASERKSLFGGNGAGRKH